MEIHAGGETRMLNGRQMVWLVVGHLMLTPSATALSSIEDLTNLPWMGDKQKETKATEDKRKGEARPCTRIYYSSVTT